MPRTKEITGIILAGGKSTRMKQDKGLVSFQGKLMVSHIIEKLESVTKKIMIITQNPAYEQFGYPCFADSIKDSGPLGAIYTGLRYSSTQKNLVVGCDTPFFSVHILNALRASSGEEAALIAEHNGKKEPLFAIYDRHCMAHFHSCILEGKLKITDALEQLNSAVINFDEAEWITGNEYANINTPEELEQFEKFKK